MQRIFNIFFGFIFLILLAGCGNGNVSLRGMVTFNDNGEPLTQGTIVFLKDGQISRGDIKPDGTFIVGTGGATDGLPSGTYQVYITGSEKVIPINEEGSNTYEPQIDRKHERPETSGLTLEVNASTRTFDIKVDRFTGTGGGR